MSASQDWAQARRKLGKLSDAGLFQGSELNDALELATAPCEATEEADRLAYLVLVLRRIPKLLQLGLSDTLNGSLSRGLTSPNAASALHSIVLSALRSDHKTVQARGQDALLSSRTIALALRSTRPKGPERYFLNGLLDEPLRSKLVNKTELYCIANLVDLAEESTIPSNLLGRVLAMVPLSDYPMLRCRIVMTLLELRAGDDIDKLVSPIIPLLQHSPDQQLLTHLSRYLFPALFQKHPEAYLPLLAALQQQQYLPAWILVASSGFDASAHRIDSLPADMLTAAAAHPSTDVRIAALSLFTKGNGAIDQTQAELIKRALLWSANVPSSEFRMSISSIMISFFTSIRSLSAKARRIDPRTSMPAEPSITAEVVQPAHNLLTWLLDEWILPSLLYVTYTSSARILLALRIYYALVTVFEKSTFAPVSGARAATEIQLKLFSEQRVDALIGCLASNFTEVRSRAEEILRLAPSPLAKYPSLESPTAQVLLESAYSCILGARNTEAEAGKALLRLVFEKLVRDIKEEHQASAIAFTNGVLNRLDSHVVASERDLVKGMALQPLHGLLSAVREVLTAVNFEDPETAHLWRPVLVRARELVDRTWAVCRVVLSATATQSTADHEIARAREALHTRGDADVEGGDEDAEEVGDGDHLILLSGCWRAMKEAGDLLSTLIALPLKARTRSKTPLPQLWTDEEVTSSGDLFLTWLHEIRHRGTFSKLALAFNRVVEVVRPFEESADSGLKGLCRRWLQTEIDTMQSGQVSTTRRSAALPYCVLSIVAGHPGLLDVASTQLFELARVSNENSTDDTKVHSFNTIRVILLDARQANSFERYFERAVVLAVDAFASNNWNVRNVGLILLSTLLSRSFSNSKKQEAFGNRQILAARKTFDAWSTKFPLLLPFFATLLTAEKAQLIETEHSALFPILIVLRNLRATEEGRDVQETLLPLVQSNLLSKDWQVREVASQAASSMVLPVDACSVAIPILAASSLRDQNGLMGHLMFVERIIHDVLDAKDAHCEKLEESLLDKLPLLLEQNSCPPTRAAFIRCVAAYGHLTGNWTSALFGRTIGVSMSILQASESRQPGSDLLDVAAANLVLALGVKTTQIVSSLMQAGTFEDVRLLAIDASTTEHQTFIAKLATDPEESDALRIRALEWLQLHQLSAGDVDVLYATAKQRRCVPLREAALPVLAAAVVASGADAANITKILKLIEAATNEEESHESRLSAVFALAHLKVALYASALPVAQSYFLAQKALYTLLIDDDDEVRAEASAIVGRGVNMVQGRAVDVWWIEIAAYLLETKEEERRMWIDWLWSVALSQTEIDNLAAELDPQLKSRELFVPEPPNIFREPLIEVQRATATLRVLKAPLPTGPAATALKSLEACSTAHSSRGELSPIDPRREALSAVQARLEMIHDATCRVQG